MKKNSILRTSKSKLTVIQPNDIKITFDSLIGLENAKEDLKDVIAYIKDPSTYDKLGIKPHMNYLISGPVGCGKKSLAYAVAHEANVPIVIVDCKDFVTEKQAAFKLLEAAFKKAIAFKYSVLLFEDFEGLLQINESFQLVFLRELAECLKVFENVVAISTLSPLTLSELVALNNASHLFEEGCFDKKLDIFYPDIKVREQMYKLFCKDVPVDPNVSFYSLASDSYDMTAKDIKAIVKNATLLAIRNGCDTVTRDHFDEMISLEYLGQERKKMTEKERRCTAYHEAGHVIAHFFADPNYKLSKVEVSYRTNSLGVTMEEADEDKLSLFKTDWENRIIGFFGGMVAERIMFGENSSGVMQDLTNATMYAKLMISAFGMSEKFGPVAVDVTYNEDESASTTSQYLLEQIDKCTVELLKNLYDRTVTIITEHRAELEALTQALLEREIVYGNEIKEIFNSVSKKIV